MLFFYIRHGDPTYSPDALTPLGHRQAEAVGRRLALHGLDRIYASTSTRAIQTAEHAAEIVGRPIETLDFCHENHAWNEYALSYNGRPKTWCSCIPEFQKIFCDPEILKLGFDWYTDPRLAEFDFGRGEERIGRESDKFFASLGYERLDNSCVYRVTKPNDERVALFAHAGFGIAFLAHILRIPYPMFSLRFEIGHSSMTVVEFSERDGFSVPRILTFSSDSHLYADRLPSGNGNVSY